MISNPPKALGVQRLRCKISQCGKRCLRTEETCRLSTTFVQKKVWANAVKEVRKSSPSIATSVTKTAVKAAVVIALAYGTQQLIDYKIKTEKDLESFVVASISVGQENMQLLAKAAGIEDIGQFMSDNFYAMENASKTIEDFTRQDQVTIERLGKTTLGAQIELAKGIKFQNEIPANWKTVKATDQERMQFLGQVLNDKERSPQVKADLDKYYKSKKSLTPEELSALRHYTDPVGYREINGTLRGDEQSMSFTMNFLRERSDKRTEAEVKQRAVLEARLASSALNKMPNYKGKVYRGGNYPQEYVDSLVVGKTVKDKAFVSTTSNITKKFPGNTQFVIESSTGKYISEYMNESQEEVLFRPETSFLITDKKVVDIGEKQVTVVYMKEKKSKNRKKKSRS